jgi:hypothetical protein
MIISQRQHARMPYVESIILSAGGAESMILSERAESIILSALPAESMILSAILSRRAESIILSAPSKRVLLSAPPAYKHVPRGSTRACQAESIILSTSGAESKILSLHAESIILSAGSPESMILSTRAESIVLSASPAESMMLSALQKHRYWRVFFVLQTCVFFAKSTAIYA